MRTDRCYPQRSIWRFSPRSLKDRILDSDCQTVITAIEGTRGGKAMPLKPIQMQHWHPAPMCTRWLQSDEPAGILAGRGQRHLVFRPDVESANPVNLRSFNPRITFYPLYLWIWASPRACSTVQLVISYTRPLATNMSLTIRTAMFIGARPMSGGLRVTRTSSMAPRQWRHNLNV